MTIVTSGIAERTGCFTLSGIVRVGNAAQFKQEAAAF
jgi:hypothetical protein